MLLDSVRHVLSHFEAEAPEPPEHPTEADLRPWRERIDVIDRALLHLLNERVRCAHAIGAIKKQVGLPVYVPSREEEVLRNVIGANTGPLPDAAVRRLFERVIDETRSLERKTFQDRIEESGSWMDALEAE